VGYTRSYRIAHPCTWLMLENAHYHCVICYLQELKVHLTNGEIWKAASRLPLVNSKNGLGVHERGCRSGHRNINCQYKIYSGDMEVLSGNIASPLDPFSTWTSCSISNRHQIQIIYDDWLHTETKTSSLAPQMTG